MPDPFPKKQVFGEPIKYLQGLNLNIDRQTKKSLLNY
jgi:hypothetical protein